MKHEEKKYEVKDFADILQKLKSLGIKEDRHATATHYYAKQSGNDVIKLVHGANKDEIHLLKESAGKFQLTGSIPVENVKDGLKWLKDKGYDDIQEIKMEHSDYPFEGGIVGLYLVNDTLHAVILDYPPDQHEAIEKKLDLESSQVIDEPFNKYIERIQGS